MKQRQISFSPPDISEEEINEVRQALRSGWITTGPRTKEFEQEIAKILPYGESRLPELGDSLHGVDSPHIGCRPRR